MNDNNNNNQEPFNPFNSNANVGLNDNNKTFSAVKFDENSQQESKEQEEFQKIEKEKKPVGNIIVNVILVILIFFAIVYGRAYIKNHPLDPSVPPAVQKLDGSFPIGYYNVHEDDEAVAIQYYFNENDPSSEGYYTVYANRVITKDDGSYSLEMDSRKIQTVKISGDTHNLVYSDQDGDLELNITYNKDKTITVQVVKNSLFYELDVLNDKTISISETLS